MYSMTQQAQITCDWCGAKTDVEIRNFDPPQFSIGWRLLDIGRWTDHPKYGMQYGNKVYHCCPKCLKEIRIP